MYRAFLIFGPEDSGNRMMTNLLVAAGCRGTSGYQIPFDQEFDHFIPAPEKDIVWLRSIPHNGSYPDIRRMIQDVWEIGYQPVIIIMTRPWWITKRAQVINHVPQNLDEAQHSLEDAYRHIFHHLYTALRCRYYLVSYSELIHEPRALKLLMRALNLPVPEFEFKNGNEKYYETLCSDTSM